MATHKSAIKRHRQSLKRRARNRFAKSTIRSQIKSALQSIESGNKEQAKEAATTATTLLDKAAIQGVLHKNTARRKISRLQKKIAATK